MSSNTDLEFRIRSGEAFFSRELYRASQAGVPIVRNVRGLCCLRPRVPGLSDNIRVFSGVGRFLEHSRIYRFENAGDPEFFIGSADWMKRNLNALVETITPVLDVKAQEGLDRILQIYETDNSTAWDCLPDGSYVRRRPAVGEDVRAAQSIFSGLARQRRFWEGVSPAEEWRARSGR